MKDAPDQDTIDELIHREHARRAAASLLGNKKMFRLQGINIDDLSEPNKRKVLAQYEWRGGRRLATDFTGIDKEITRRVHEGWDEGFVEAVEGEFEGERASLHPRSRR